MKTKIVLTVVLIAFVFSAIAQVPTRWRGPEGNGTYSETGLLKSWPDNGPQIVWAYDKLGEGFSSPAFANQMIYISGMEGSTGYVYALSQDGKLIWKKAYGTEFTESYPGSRSTPVVAGDLLYIYSAFGVVTCMSANSGDIKWSKDLFKDMGGEQIQWGVNETPVIDGEKIYITPGGKQHNVVALNRMNGNLIWSSKPCWLPIPHRILSVWTLPTENYSGRRASLTAGVFIPIPRFITMDQFFISAATARGVDCLNCRPTAVRLPSNGSARRWTTGSVVPFWLTVIFSVRAITIDSGCASTGIPGR
jgi:hypothetical protein